MARISEGSGRDIGVGRDVVGTGAGVFEVSQQATDTARHIPSLRERHRQLITDAFGRAAGNGHRVLEHLYRHPIIAVTEAQNLI